MLNDASGFRRIYLATGYTDLRRGMEGLASIIKFNFQLDPYQKDILFLFCGRRTDRIKGLVWEGDGFPHMNMPNSMHYLYTYLFPPRLIKRSSHYSPIHPTLNV